MAHPAEVRAAVRAAYIYQRQPLGVAAESAGVPESTARQWLRQSREAGDDWELARSAVALSREGQLAVAQAVLEGFVLQFQATLAALREAPDLAPLERAEILARLSDSYSKMMASAAKASTPISRLSVAMETLRILGRWLSAERPDLLDSYADVLDQFGPSLASELGHG
jgi:hypothetical protein